MKKGFLTLACAMLLFSCSKDDQNDGQTSVQTLQYQQTACSDQWGGSQQSDPQMLSELRSFLNRQGLYHSDETVSAEGPHEMCNACQCRTGKTIYVRTLRSQEQAYMNLGFHH